MPNYTASHRTKPYFNIHSRDVITFPNGNHCPVLPVTWNPLALLVIHIFILWTC